MAVTVRNPAQPDRMWTGLFRADTGAIDCVVPRQHLEAIGLTSKGQRTYELADGNPSGFDITTAQVEFMGEFAGATIVIVDEDTEPLLGRATLASVGIEVDPCSEGLKEVRG